MNDRTTSVSELGERVEQFVAERQWAGFHSPKNLAMSIAIEAAELMEHFQWLSVDESREVATDARRRGAAAEELADVVCYALAMARALGIDLTTAVVDKMAKNALKYPADEYRGRYGPDDPAAPAPKS